jgi:UDP-2,4-diacetamido-2,4,6-trideoxy-beta-L-altropyranose hydrolase
LEADTFIIRVDASQSIGLGHLNRCLLIANFLKKKGLCVVFVTQQDLSQSIIRSKNFQCLKIDKGDYTEGVDFSRNYKSFVVIVDVNTDAVFSSISDYFNHLDNLRRGAKLLITLEDLVDYPYCSDVVIIPYCGATNLKLRDDCNTKYLLGPNYFLLRNEFNDDSFVVSSNAKNILITMGGSDPEKITLKVLKSISKLDVPYGITIVLGRASKVSVKDINKMMYNYKSTITILRDVENMSKIMLDCDVAITNSGLTRYELSALGVPSIIISNNKQQALYSDDFSSYGSSIHLGDISVVSEKYIRENCVSLMQNSKLRLDMSDKGKSLVDSNGLNRVWNVIIECKL